MAATAVGRAQVGRRALAQMLAFALGVVVTLALPLFVVSTSARAVIGSDWLYQWGFESFGIERVTQIEQSELLAASRDIRSYFEDGRERLTTVVQRNGSSFTLFNEREVLHMEDVKGLMQALYQTQTLTTMVMLAAAVLAVVLPAWRQPAGLGLVCGAGLTLAAGVMAGLAAAIDFQGLFLQFHLLSFSNDLWLLDPRRDFLIMMFPYEFFFGALLAIVAGVVVLCLAALAGGIVLVRRASETIGRQA